MTLRYASLLAATKFRTRLWRSLLTVVAASLVAAIMLFASFALTGAENSLKGVQNTELSQLHLVREYLSVPPLLSESEAPVPNPDVKVPTLAEYRSELFALGVKEAYEERFYGSLALVDPKPAASAQSFGTQGLTFSGRSAALYEASVSGDTAPVAAGTVPVAINQDVILELAGVRLNPSDPASKRVAQTKEALEAWRGKVMTWERMNEDGTVTTLKTTAQSFLSGGGLLSGGSDVHVLAPLESLEGVLTPEGSDNGATYFAAFPSEESQLEYVKRSHSQTDFSATSPTSVFRYAQTFGNPLLELREIRDQAAGVLKYVVIALLIAVILAMLTTISKIISDSERETGVFRAIGAKTTDLLQIYLGYAVLVAALATLLATAVAALLSLYLTNRFGEDLSYQLITLSGSPNLSARFSLFGINPLHMGAVFLAVLGSAVIGTLLPLIGLFRRDPIKALRAE